MTFDKIQLLKDNNTFIILDVETTGLYQKNGDTITDLCAYKLVNGEVVATFNKLVNPCKRISPYIEELTGITNDMVKWAPTFNDIAQDFVNFIGYDIIVGHNVSFDWDKMLHAILLEQCGYDAPNKTLCTLELSRTFVRGKGRKHKLEDMYLFFTGERPTVKHRAEADVVMTVEVFKGLQKFVLDNYIQIAKCYGLDLA